MSHDTGETDSQRQRREAIRLAMNGAVEAVGAGLQAGCKAPAGACDLDRASNCAACGPLVEGVGQVARLTR